MLLIHGKLVADAEKFLDRVAYGIEAAIAVGIYDRFFVPIGDSCLCHDPVTLPEVAFADGKMRHIVDIIVTEDLIYPLRGQLFVLLVGYLLDGIVDLLAHFIRNGDGEVLL